MPSRGGWIGRNRHEPKEELRMDAKAARWIRPSQSQMARIKKPEEWIKKPEEWIIATNGKSEAGEEKEWRGGRGREEQREKGQREKIKTPLPGKVKEPWAEEAMEQKHELEAGWAFRASKVLVPKNQAAYWRAAAEAPRVFRGYVQRPFQEQAPGPFREPAPRRLKAFLAIARRLRLASNCQAANDPAAWAAMPSRPAAEWRIQARRQIRAGRQIRAEEDFRSWLDHPLLLNGLGGGSAVMGLRFSAAGGLWRCAFGCLRFFAGFQRRFG